MVETVAHFGTGLGLAAGAGLNAYAVLLVYGGIAHFFPEDFPGAIARFLAEPATLAVLLGLYLLEFVADKIPGLDHVWDVVHTVVRPVAGASSRSRCRRARRPRRRWRSWPAGAEGSRRSLSHLVKGTARLTSTALTAGVANFALSLAEDILAVLQAIVSIFLPLVALVLAVAVAGIFLLCVPKLSRGREPLRPATPKSGTTGRLLRPKAVRRPRRTQRGILDGDSGRTGDRRSDGADRTRGGKSGLQRAACRGNPGRGNPKESGTENIPPRFPQGGRGKGEKVR